MLDKVVANDSAGNLSHIFSGFQLQDFSFYCSNKPTRGMGVVRIFDFALRFICTQKSFPHFSSFFQRENEHKDAYTGTQRIKKCVLYSPKLCVPQRINIDNVNIILVRTEVAILKYVCGVGFVGCVRTYVSV